jgi:uncharacterized hydrophobic protein (TIGR00271 family)
MVDLKQDRLIESPPYLVVVAVRDERDLEPLAHTGCALAREREGKVRIITVTPDGEKPAWLEVPSDCSGFPVETVVRAGRDAGPLILKEVRRNEADMLLVGWGGKVTRGEYALGRTLDPVVQNAPCDVLLVRAKGVQEIERILIPVAGGPNAPLAFEVARTLAPDAHITALYVASQRLGDVMLGRERIKSVLDTLDDASDIESRVVQAEGPVEGILEETARDYDLLLIGAGRESVVGRFLFGDIPRAILLQASAPVMVIRPELTNLGSLQRRLWTGIFGLMPTLSVQEQAEVYRTLRRGARPSADFWVMLTLASAIAAFGLLLDSPAIIIGAMIIAPLMTALLGMAMSIVLGDLRFLWRSFSTTVRGVLIGVAVGLVVTLIVPGTDATEEILIRTYPTLLDLAVALGAGGAAAYAASRPDVSAALAGVAIAAALAPPLVVIGIGLGMLQWQIAGGAALLFLTNIVAIVVAGSLMFLWLGFRPQPGNVERTTFLRRGVLSVALLLLLISIPLGVLTYTSFERADVNSSVEAALATELRQNPGLELVEWAVTGELEDGTLQLDVILRAPQPISYQGARDLQERVAARLERPVALSLGIVPTTRLRAFAPPPTTPTPTPTPTPAPGSALP